MNYTVSVNEAKKEIVVMLDGYKGVAKCCPTDNFNLGTGIELALERAKVAKAEANKPKPKTDMSVAAARKILEDYVGDHIAIIGKGDTLSENQRKELRYWADKLAPIDKCCDCCGCDCCDYDEDEDEIVEDELDELSELAARMIRRIREILDK